MDAAGSSIAHQGRALWLSTVSFTICFAVWTIFAIIGIRIKQELGLNDTQFGLLVGTPILSGSLIRLLLGIWTDQYGGRRVYTVVMLAAAVATYLLTWAHTYPEFLVAALFVGIAGGSFAVGIAYVSRFYQAGKQGTALGIFGAGLLGWSPFGSTGFPNFGGMFGGSRNQGQSSRVRSQYLDMSLDHDSGVLKGQIVAGPQAGRMLDEFDLSQLLAMVPSFDAESVALLESYLDRRFPAWRQDAQGDRTGGQGGAAATGKMTNEEAYQILGLQPGASRDDISRAHRTLMKKLHPDQGGSTYLAARVNEAKDTLLRTHL